jgi:hypothetical protein
MIFAGNISPASVRSAVCTDWKDDGNWAARLPAQGTKGEQEEPLPPIHEGREQEERVAQTPQQMEKEGTLELRHHQQQGKLMLVASLVRTCGAREACDDA